jgi:hypothetical protein
VHPKRFYTFTAMEKKELKLTIQLTEKDYLKFQRAHAGGAGSRKWMAYGLLMLILCGLVVVPSILLNGFSSTMLPAFLPLFIIIALSTMAYVLRIYKTKSAFRNDAFINQPYDITLNEEGITVNGYRSNFSPIWKDVYRYTVTKEAVYIYVSDVKALLIPVRYLGNNADTAILFELLKNNVTTENYTRQKKQKTSIRILSYVVMAGVVCFILFKDCGKEKRFGEARQLQKNNDFAGAKRIYSELIANDPKDIHNYLERSKCELSLSEFSLAVSDCETAIRLNPNSGKAYYYYAYALYDNEQYDEACEAINRSINLGYTRNNQGLCE